MTIFTLFIDFINEILNINFLGLPIHVYLLSTTIIIFLFKLIEIIGNSDKNTKGG